MIHIEEEKNIAEISGTTEEILNDFGNAAMIIYTALTEDVGADAAGYILRHLFYEALRRVPENYSHIKVPVKEK